MKNNCRKFIIILSLLFLWNIFLGCAERQSLRSIREEHDLELGYSRGNKNRLNGAYCDNLGVTALIFDGNKVIMTSLEGGETGTYTLIDNVISIRYNDGGMDTFDYDPNSDSFSFGGDIFVFEKVPNGTPLPNKEMGDSILQALRNATKEAQEELEREKALLESKRNKTSLDNSSNNSSNFESSPTYFKEDGSLKTPDSAVKGITFAEEYEDGYIYKLGDNEDEADTRVRAWMAYLMIEDYSVKDADNRGVSFMVSKEGSSRFVFIVGQLDYGYVMFVSFM